MLLRGARYALHSVGSEAASAHYVAQRQVQGQYDNCGSTAWNEQ